MSDQATIFEKEGFLRCEQRGKDVLLLERLPELGRAFNGRMYRHAITYRWLSNPSDRTSVLGSERTFCTYQEAANGLRNGLFSAFRLFP